MNAATSEDLASVLRRYPLKAPTVDGRHEAGIINDNWLVTDSAGERYFLRGYRRVRERERVLFQLKFQDYLRTHGFPTAAVIRTNDDEPIVTVGGEMWCLFQYIHGIEFDFSRIGQAGEAGRRLAEFHAIAAGYDGSVVPGETDVAIDFASWPPVSSHTWDNSVLGDEYQERLKQLFAGRAFESELAFFSDWRRHAAASWPPERLASLPQSWLHCDYHGRNMVFRGDEMVGLFDFDFVTRGPRTFDVGRGIFNFGREKRGSTAMREAFCGAFMEGYEFEASLSVEERKALPFMAVLNWAPDAAFYEARRPEEGDIRIGERLQFDIGMMRGIQADMQRLAPAFGWKAV